MIKILVSSCLLGHNVRYDGGNSLQNHPLLKRWLKQGRLVSFCPEVSAGLPTPRPAVEIAQQQPLKLVDQEKTDYTDAFIRGAENTLRKMQTHQITCALLKAKSPSCGRDEIYSGQFNAQLVMGDGVTAALLKQQGYLLFNEFELEKLADYISENEEASSATTSDK